MEKIHVVIPVPDTALVSAVLALRREWLQQHCDPTLWEYNIEPTGDPKRLFDIRFSFDPRVADIAVMFKLAMWNHD